MSANSSGTGSGPAYYRHPAALVESESVGKGTRIWAFAHVLKGAVIGEECNLGDHAFVEGGATVGNRVTLKNGVAVWSGVTLEDDVFVGPNAVFTNDLFPRSPRFVGAQKRYAEGGKWLVTTRVGRGASIGANATIRCGVEIGSFAMVGAGTVVTRSIPAHALVLGVPGRVAGWVCECGERLALREDKTAKCALCDLKFALVGETLSRSTD